MRYFVGDPLPWEEVSPSIYRCVGTGQLASISEDGFDLVSVRTQGLPLNSLQALVKLMGRSVNDGSSESDNPTSS